jgi:hypothetical protein
MENLLLERTMTGYGGASPWGLLCPSAFGRGGGTFGGSQATQPRAGRITTTGSCARSGFRPESVRPRTSGCARPADAGPHPLDRREPKTHHRRLSAHARAGEVRALIESLLFSSRLRAASPVDVRAEPRGAALAVAGHRACRISISQAARSCRLGCDRSRPTRGYTMPAGAFSRRGRGRSVLRRLLSSRWFRRYALRRILYSRAFWRLVFRLVLWRLLLRSVRAYLGKRLAARRWSSLRSTEKS